LGIHLSSVSAEGVAHRSTERCAGLTRSGDYDSTASP
jgi:hypothetical protein